MINSRVDVMGYVFTEENVTNITEAAAATTNTEAERVTREQHQINFIIITLAI